MLCSRAGVGIQCFGAVSNTNPRLPRMLWYGLGIGYHWIPLDTIGYPEIQWFMTKLQWSIDAFLGEVCYLPFRMHPDTLEQSNIPENASLTILENSPQFSNAATRF